MSNEKQRKIKSKGKQQGKKTLRCHNYDGIEHFAKDCLSEKYVKAVKKGNNKESSIGHDVKEAFISAQSDSDSEFWIADSAACKHITRRKEWFSELIQLDPPEQVRIGDNEYLDATAKGTIDIRWQ